MLSESPVDQVRVTFAWIPFHCGLSGNEQAYSLVGEVVAGSERAFEIPLRGSRHP